jgi:hypothetical protein
MIKISRIAGESYELETGKRFPKAIVLTNGIREVAIHVPDEIVTQLLQMEAESSGNPQNVAPRGPSQIEDDDVDRRELSVPVSHTLEDQMSSDEEDFEPAEREVGEEYNDPDTGAASI